MSKNSIAYEHNCFTIGRFGEPKVGLKLDTSPGFDPSRPLWPRLYVGSHYITLDRYSLPAVESDGTVKLAEAREVNLSDKPSFTNLSKPSKDRPETSLVYVNYRLPGKKGVIHVDGFPTNLFTGFAGGRFIKSANNEALVELAEGQALTVFFEDGGVRNFRRQGQRLEELESLTADEMLTARIEQVKYLVEEGQPHDFLKVLIHGMVDLLLLTTRFNQRGLGQGMRMRLMREFFLELHPDVRLLCWGRLGNVLRQIDSALCSMLHNTGSAPRAAVVDINDRRQVVEAMSPEDRAAEKARNRRRDEEARAAKEAVQQRFREGRRNKPVTKDQPKQGKKNKKKAA